LNRIRICTGRQVIIVFSNRLRITLAGASSICLTLAVACGSEAESSPTPGNDPDAATVPDTLAPDSPDAAGDAGSPTATCALDSPFTSVADVGLSTRMVTLRDDELEIFTVDAAGVLRHAKRASIGVPFDASEVVDLPSPAQKVSVSITGDGLSLYVVGRVEAPPAPPFNQLFLAERTTPTSAFGAATSLPLSSPPATTFSEIHLAHDRSGLYFVHQPSGTPLTFLSALPSGTLAQATEDGGDVFGEQILVARGLVPTRDGLHLYAGMREAGDAGELLFVDGTRKLALASRASTAVPFDRPTYLAAPAHTAGADERPVWLSKDQCRLYFLSGSESADAALKVATRAP
jgi:hypothetical protein